MTTSTPLVPTDDAWTTPWAATDALLRFAAGQDLRDPELFASAFTADAVLDFTHPATSFGADIPVMVGRQAILQIMDVVAPMITTHTVTNCRPLVDGDRGSLTALVEAQHVMRDDPTRHLLLKNIYEVELRREDTWRMTEVTIRLRWWNGDPTVLFGPEALSPTTHD